ncbi:C45 family autoproteolytic acyltransferase/hydolase [Salinicoccus halitifaciens]|uniref:Isopenicillin-N N-acyltransferase-like protein n=1 Tax=Salinicoccus halitifaciens TaxID=1073415 RepID=A0ABV2E7U2_9STAP|nr:C45 family peptidase [Salinicoccus halitifaciens]MCD2136452.1 C45 family peptidase [Salinicoccus halitifaciens]
MKHLKIQGKAYEIGYQHGTEAKREVHYSLDSYERLFHHEKNIAWNEAREIAKDHINYLDRNGDGFLEEIEGIAKGASVDFEDILALNTRSEIALTGNTDGCTSFGVISPGSENLYLAQTWDWRPSQKRSLLTLDIETDGTEVVMVTEAGILGKIGMNNHGLGVCLNALRVNDRQPTLPIHITLRKILNSGDIDEALGIIQNKEVASAANLLVGQDDAGSTRKIVNNEVTVTHIGSREITETGHVYHTNHICSSEILDNLETEHSSHENSYQRLEKIDELISTAIEENETIDHQQIREWLSNHDNAPYTICRHGGNPARSHYTDTVTAFGISMNLTKKNLHIMEGTPCSPTETYYHEFSN